MSTSANATRTTTVISVRGKSPDELHETPGFIYVGRAMPRQGWPPSIWGNPFKVGRKGLEIDWRRVRSEWFDAEIAPHIGSPGYRSAVDLYRWWVCASQHLVGQLPALRGAVLGCWCGFWQPGQPDIGCHGVVLARLADAIDPEVIARCVD